MYKQYSCRSSLQAILTRHQRGVRVNQKLADSHASIAWLFSSLWSLAMTWCSGETRKPLNRWVIQKIGHLQTYANEGKACKTAFTKACSSLKSSHGLECNHHSHLAALYAIIERTSWSSNHDIECTRIKYLESHEASSYQVYHVEWMEDRK